MMKFSFFYGIANTIGASIISIVIYSISTENDYWIFLISAPISALITSIIFWSFICLKKISYTRIIITGILTGSISHHCFWMINVILLHLCQTIGSCITSLNEPILSIPEILIYGWGYTLFSIFFTGWITIIWAIVSGILIKIIFTYNQE